MPTASRGVVFMSSGEREQRCWDGGSFGTRSDARRGDMETNMPLLFWCLPFIIFSDTFERALGLRAAETERH
jgi:hypothetical protein